MKLPRRSDHPPSPLDDAIDLVERLLARRRIIVAHHRQTVDTLRQDISVIARPEDKEQNS